MMRNKVIAFVLLLAALLPWPAPAALILNLSTRVEIPPPFLGPDVTSVIGGFIIGGTKSRKVLIRAIGPSLADFGLVPLADPTLTLYDASGSVIATKDNWMDTQETDIRDTGLQPNDPLESGIVMTLTPGTYTAVVQGQDPVPGDPKPTSGTALVEVYDLSPIIAAALQNLSTRGAVQGTENPMIVGFILGNGDDVPSLIPFGLSGLTNPLRKQPSS
jgi:hypothetical protein